MARQRSRAAIVAVLTFALPRGARADERGTHLLELEGVAAAAVGQSRAAVGLDDGVRLGPGFGLSAAAVGRAGDDVLATRLGAAASLGADLDDGTLAKSQDEVSLSASWLHEWTGWLGTLVRAGTETSFLAGTARSAGPTDFRVSRRDGTELEISRRALRLTEPLAPLDLDGALEVLLRPVVVPAIAVHLHAGAHARATFAEGALAATSGPDAPVTHLQELSDVAQIGPGGGVELGGTIAPIGLRYRGHGGVLLPALHDGPEDAPGQGLLARMLVEMGAAARLPIANGVALEHDFRTVFEPLLVETFQFQLGLRAIFVAGVASGDPLLGLATPRSLR